jgi:hypothetical protein
MKYQYTYNWSCTDGLGHKKYGDDIVNSDVELSEDELKEKISEAIGGGAVYLLGGQSDLLDEANTCDAGCNDWKIYSLRLTKHAGKKVK